MAQQIINLGATGSGAGGDSARTAFEKAIANFAELYQAALPGTAAQKQAARAQFGIPDPQSDANDLGAGKLALTDSVRRVTFSGVSNTYCDRLILLHPLYVSSLLPHSIVDGKFTATRGSAGSSLNQTSAEVISSSAYNSHATALYDTSGNPADPWQAVSCNYQGKKYAALIVPYQASAYGGGIFFEGRAVSDDPNQLRCIEYYNRQTATVLNSEVHSSIAPLYTQKDFRISGSRVFHTGNILGTVSQSGGVPTGAIIERGSNANGEYVRYADGTQICWSRRVRNATTNPGQAKSVDVTTAAGFVGEYDTFADGTFYSGADATGQVLYALPLKVGTGWYIWNQGTSPSGAAFAFSVGSLVALSSLESVLHIGRWH